MRKLILLTLVLSALLVTTEARLRSNPHSRPQKVLSPNILVDNGSTGEGDDETTQSLEEDCLVLGALPFLNLSRLNAHIQTFSLNGSESSESSGSYTHMYHQHFNSPVYASIHKDGQKVSLHSEGNTHFSTMRVSTENGQQVFVADELQIHTPGRHTVIGKPVELELVFVHKTQGRVSNEEEEQFVTLSYLFRRGNFKGGDIPLTTSSPQDQVPLTVENFEDIYSESSDLQIILLDLSNLNLADRFDYFNYEGFIHLPPCDVPTNWIVYPRILYIGEEKNSVINSNTDYQSNFYVTQSPQNLYFVEQ